MKKYVFALAALALTLVACEKKEEVKDTTPAQLVSFQLLKADNAFLDTDYAPESISESMLIRIPGGGMDKTFTATSTVGEHDKLYVNGKVIEGTKAGFEGKYAVDIEVVNSKSGKTAAYEVKIGKILENKLTKEASYSEGSVDMKSDVFLSVNPETKKYDVDENGNYVLERETLSVTPKETAGERRYYVTYSQRKEVIDIYGAPSAKHILGTDGDGYDVFSRIMYGGRVSLIVGFVVVILETILGVIMGGIAGFFGGWVDTLIMRLVDIFYCIPTMPIMIILASLFDQLQMPPYNRLFWMMVVWWYSNVNYTFPKSR